MVGGSAAAAVVFLVVIMHFASAPSYSTLLTGLDPAQTGKITSTLDAKGIAYQIQNGGTALAVESSQTSQARIALATAGLLGVGSTQPGFELLNSSQLGASNFQQQVTYQRALEGQLDQTIEQIQGIDSATVNLVLPNQQDELFGDNSQSSSASVLLVRLRQRRLEPGQGHRRARRLERAGPGRPEGHDHRLDRRPAVARVGLGRLRRRPDLPAVGRQPVRRDHRRGRHRPARSDARPRQGAGRRERQPERQPGDLGHSDLRQEGRAADRADRRPRRSRAAAPRPPARPARSRRTPRAPARARRTTRTRPRTPPTASTRPSPTR